MIPPPPSSRMIGDRGDAFEQVAQADGELMGSRVRGELLCHLVVRVCGLPTGPRTLEGGKADRVGVDGSIARRAICSSKRACRRTSIIAFIRAIADGDTTGCRR